MHTTSGTFEIHSQELARLAAEAIKGINDPILRVNHPPAKTLWSGSGIAIVDTSPGLAGIQSLDGTNALSANASEWEGQIRMRIENQGTWDKEKWTGRIQHNLKRIFHDAFGSSGMGMLRGALYFNLYFLSSRGIDDLIRYGLDIKHGFSLFSKATDFILTTKSPAIVLAFGNTENSPYAYLTNRYGRKGEEREQLSHTKTLKRADMSINGRSIPVYGLRTYPTPFPRDF